MRNITPINEPDNARSISAGMSASERKMSILRCIVTDPETSIRELLIWRQYLDDYINILKENDHDIGESGILPGNC